MPISTYSSIEENHNFSNYPIIVQELIKAHQITSREDYKPVYAVAELKDSGYILLNLNDYIMFYHRASHALYNDYSCHQGCRITREIEKNTQYPTGNIVFTYPNKMGTPPAVTGITQFTIKENDISAFIEFVYGSCAAVDALYNKVNPSRWGSLGEVSVENPVTESAETTTESTEKPKAVGRPSNASKGI